MGSQSPKGAHRAIPYTQHSSNIRGPTPLRPRGRVFDAKAPHHGRGGRKDKYHAGPSQPGSHDIAKSHTLITTPAPPLAAMAFLTTYEAYVPPVPSPLNPAASVRRRRAFFFCRGRVQMSPSERLLRRKAAAAWACETTYRQATQYERKAIDDLDQVVVSKVVWLPAQQKPPTPFHREKEREREKADVA